MANLAERLRGRPRATPRTRVSLTSHPVSREGAYDPRALLASPVWATLARARAAGEPRPADLDAIRAILADVARR